MAKFGTTVPGTAVWPRNDSRDSGSAVVVRSPLGDRAPRSVGAKRVRHRGAEPFLAPGLGAFGHDRRRVPQPPVVRSRGRLGSVDDDLALADAPRMLRLETDAS